MPTALPKRGYAGRTAEQRRAERRERMLEAGLQLFGTEGYVSASIEKLCAAAGVSTRNFYQEFTGREALLLELHDGISGRATEAVVRAMGEMDHEGLLFRVEMAVRAYIEAITEDPRAARIACVEIIGVSPEVERSRQEWRRRWVLYLVGEMRRAVDRGEAQDRDYQMTCMAVIGAVSELVYHWTLRPHTSRDQLIIELTRLVMAVLTYG
ncbi:TetR/AcrR family transcriptional regulator [Pseudonocardiaceae bacterium YIM PH 21723]|nr:TetR/AcrR family transcriptional regulator [Pseudonocardiaceae bacterium YIM PH 21723]